MAVYKVPQDVEADDKLIGPFSFRQFIYLVIVAIAGAIAWGLAQLFIGLAIIPLPIILFFGALALPLRKDQPMEIYLAAIVSFYLKPRRRLWQADGIQSLVEITVPKVTEIQRAKNLTQSEAEQRLSYLADIVDTGGWAIRGVTQPQASNAMQNDVFFEAQQAEDILGDDGGVARSFNTMMTQSDQRHRQEIINKMHQSVQPPAPVTSSIPDPYVNLEETPVQTLQPVEGTPPAFQTQVTNPTQVQFNPYPSSMHQSVVTPLSEQRVTPPPAPVTAPPAAPAAIPTPQPASQQPQPPQPTPPAPITTSEKVVSPDIMNLANNHDFSIATIANEANRIRQQELDTENEVVISLR